MKHGQIIRVTRDLFGIIDMLAFPKKGGTVAIQYTDHKHVATRIRKIRSCPMLPVLLRAGWKVVVWGWTPRKLAREVWIE